LSEIDEIRKIVANVPDAQVMTDLDATVDWIKASGDGNVKKLGVTGFCWGGRIVWLYAAHSAQVKAGVAWYGRPIGKATELQPAHPLDMAANLKVPVLGLYGGSDQGIPLETVEQMKQALRAAGSPSTIIVYQIRRTPSMRTIGRAIARKRLKTAGAICLHGSRNMGLPNPAAY
jgi:carboxymethylenebutenolidase